MPSVSEASQGREEKRREEKRRWKEWRKLDEECCPIAVCAGEKCDVPGRKKGRKIERRV